MPEELHELSDEKSKCKDYLITENSNKNDVVADLNMTVIGKKEKKGRWPQFKEDYYN